MPGQPDSDWVNTQAHVTVQFEPWMCVRLVLNGKAEPSAARGGNRPEAMEWPPSGYQLTPLPSSNMM
jgi:hypothetical protein